MKRNVKKTVWNKIKMKKAMVVTALGLSLAMGTTSVPVLNNVATVEATSKKDRKKPKIKFSGKKQLQGIEGEKVTIPKTTYSDNQTKKKKLKVAVTVKRGNNNYKSIANKIKTATVKNKPVDVVFEEEGKYKITTTVTDLSKNKATAVRYVTVNDKEEITTEEIVTKVDPEPIVTPTPEEPARTVTTETPVTEEPKKEEPKKEEPKQENQNLSDYASYDTVEINGNKYNIVKELKQQPQDIAEANIPDDTLYLNYSNIPYDNMYLEFPVVVGVGTESEYANDKYLPLYVVGKIKAGFIHEFESKDGLVTTFKDLSDNVLLEYEENGSKIKVYIVTDKKEFYYIEDIEYRVEKFYDLNVDGKNLYGLDTFKDYSVNKEEQVIVAPGLATDELDINQKKLTLKKVDLGKEY